MNHLNKKRGEKLKSHALKFCPIILKVKRSLLYESMPVNEC